MSDWTNDIKLNSKVSFRTIDDKLKIGYVFGYAPNKAEICIIDDVNKTHRIKPIMVTPYGELVSPTFIDDKLKMAAKYVTKEQSKDFHDNVSVTYNIDESETKRFTDEEIKLLNLSVDSCIELLYNTIKNNDSPLAAFDKTIHRELTTLKNLLKNVEYIEYKELNELL